MLLGHSMALPLSSLRNWLGSLRFEPRFNLEPGLNLLRAPRARSRHVAIATAGEDLGVSYESLPMIKGMLLEPPNEAPAKACFGVLHLLLGSIIGPR